MKRLLASVYLCVSLLTSSIGNASESVPEKNLKTASMKKTVNQENRKPDSAETAEKKPFDFAPVYKVRERVDVNIKNSVDYLK